MGKKQLDVTDFGASPVTDQLPGKVVEDHSDEAGLVSDRRLRTLRIEGEVTPLKKQMAKQFEQIFDEAASEIEELSSYKPPQGAEALLESLGKEKVREIIAAKPLQVFSVSGKFLIKTNDNKIEYVNDYCTRLEKSVISMFRMRTDLLVKVQKVPSFVWKFIEAVETFKSFFSKLTGGKK